MSPGRQNPESCFVDCQKQGLLTNVKDSLFFGISQENLCMCGLNLNPKDCNYKKIRGICCNNFLNHFFLVVSGLGMLQCDANSLPCPDSQADFCGSKGNPEYFTYYDITSFPAYPTNNIDLKVTDPTKLIIHNQEENTINVYNNQLLVCI